MVTYVLLATMSKKELTTHSNEIYARLKAVSDEYAAVKMAAYMRDQFPFLGVHTPERRKIYKEYFRSAGMGRMLDWGFIDSCWENEYREMQYVAVDHLVAMKRFLTPVDVPKLKRLALSRSWWDTIDGLDRIIGSIALDHPELQDTLLEWSTDDNIWLRRISIDHQLLRKERTDTNLLERIILNNLGHPEFFINKAIGWSLRDYSKTDPEWVSDFLMRHGDRMSALSIREASKYL